MKRFLLISLVLSLFATSTALAQKNRVSGAMSVIKIDTIKTKKVFETVDVKRGFEQEINLAYSYIDLLTNHVNLNYIAGYRFNHFLYAGVGTGLDFGCSNNYKPFVGIYDSGIYADKDFYSYSDEAAPVQKVAIPLYAHFKAYFMKTRWAPFLAFSAGARFSAAKKAEVLYRDEHLRTERYGAVTGMFEILPGVSFKYNDKYAFNLQIGYATRSGYDWWDSNTFKRFWYHGLTVKLGVVF